MVRMKNIVSIPKQNLSSQVLENKKLFLLLNIAITPFLFLIYSFFLAEIYRSLKISNLIIFRTTFITLYLLSLFLFNKLFFKTLIDLRKEYSFKQINFQNIFFKSLKKFDFIITIIALFFVFSSFAFDSYTSPSASVQYYLGYDYLRFFYDQGLYRPNLPELNPVGTWLNMLTYNPAIFSLPIFISKNSDFESYRQIMGFLTGFFNIGYLSICGIISYIICGFSFLGISIGIFFFASLLNKYSLVTSGMFLSSSHDTPFIYLALLFCLIFFVFIITRKSLLKKREILSSKKRRIIFFFLTLTGLFSISVRPYLVGLFVPLVYASFIIFGDILGDKFLSLQKKIRQLLITFSGVVFISCLSLFWQINLFAKYSSFSTYKPSEQFLLLHNYRLNQFKVLLDSLLGIGFPKTFIFNPFITIISILCIFLLCIIFNFFHLSERPINNLPQSKALNICFDILIINMISIAFIFLWPATNGNWKSYLFPVSIGYILFPIIFLSSLISLFLNRAFLYSSNNKKHLFVFITLFAFISSVNLSFLSNTFALDFDKRLFNDNNFRAKVRDEYNSQKSKNKKILVLFGGEPGGDSQTFIPSYYYWDHVFLYGQLDKYIMDLNSEEEFKKLLDKFDVKFIFEPSSLQSIRDANYSHNENYKKLYSYMKSKPKCYVESIKSDKDLKPIFYTIKEDGCY